MRTIDADKLEKDLMDMAHNELMPDYFRQICMSMAERVSKEPTIEAEPVRHGKWIKDNDGFHHCSECGENTDRQVDAIGYDISEFMTIYCGNCGAKIDGKEE